MNKMSGLGLSVLTVSVFSVASLSSNTISGNVTSSINNSYCYEAVSIISDENGEMCLSSSLGEQANMYQNLILKKNMRRYNGISMV